MRRSLGFTLLETLLALSVAAVIVVLGLRQYRTYREALDRQDVMHNVTVLQQAILSFYHATPCSYSDALGHGGIFPSQYITDQPNLTPILITDGFVSVSDLRLTNYFQTVDGYPYVVHIIDTGQVFPPTVGATNPKPVYAAQVDALPMSTMSTTERDFLAQAWHARVTTNNAGQTVLRWQQLLGRQSAAIDNRFAALQGGSSQFVRLANWAESVDHTETRAAAACLN